MMRAAAEGASRSVAVLVVSGFLGSGKTTLVRHLLAESARMGLATAVVSNELGELGIDAALLGSSAASYVEIEGGCVCCLLADRLVETLQMLYERVQPDRIVIETSGVGLPSDTLLHLWREPVAQWVEEDLSVVVVSALQLYEGRELLGTCEDQIAGADLLLLNKIDLVPASAVPELATRLEAMTADTAVLPCERGRVDPAVLFPPAPSLPEGASPGAVRPRRPRTPLPHTHEDYAAEERALPAGLTPGALLDELSGWGALRIKGFVDTAEGVRLVQGVGPRIQIEPPHTAPPPELIGRVVVIRRVGSRG
jgi:G3E family GTPase